MLKILLAICLLLSLTVAQAEQTVPLQVSATILPWPCEFPDPCEQVAQTTPTKVSVAEGIVSYVGTRPSITESNGLLIVTF